MTRTNFDSLRARLGRPAALAFYACLSSAAISCAAPTGAEPEATQAEPSLYQLAPQGPFVDVQANGTGCPAGTWTSTVSEDGTTFSIAFDTYLAHVSPSNTIDIKDCMLSIELADAPGVQYAVESFAYHGAAALSEGARATMSANYYFQGSPDLSTTASTDLTGPVFDYFDYHDAPAVEQLRWSECGVQRDLNVTTRIVLRNGSATSASAMVVNSAEGSGHLVLRVAARDC